MDLEKRIISQIKDANQRMTKQKEKMLALLIENKDRMMNVQEIINRISESDKMDDATIYRNLNSFVMLGILEQTMDNNGVFCYKIECEQGHHHHLICISCGKVINIPCDHEYFSRIAKEHNFLESFHTIEVYGKCGQCVKNDKS